MSVSSADFQIKAGNPSALSVTSLISSESYHLQHIFDTEIYRFRYVKEVTGTYPIMEDKPDSIIRCWYNVKYFYYQTRAELFCYYQGLASKKDIYLAIAKEILTLIYVSKHAFLFIIY